MTDTHAGPVDVTADEFRALYRALSNWGRWGEDDERGALHHLTPERVAAAAAWCATGSASR